MTALQKKRCAIYTRKSSEEGLEQDFNSLAAQREACEAYIVSQRSDGWMALPQLYDDGGFSGGNLNRPALQQLLEHINASQIDIVVVYKVDRLTRALADFAKLVDQFDAHDVSVVAVTQPFNTTTSMGRLTLNVLLSFAQFEREITGERIRDKIAASKQKGMWMGGCVPLGYDAVDRRLIVNEPEAEKVRHIFQRYLALGSVYHLMRELERDAIRSKARTGRDGRQRGNAHFSRGALYPLLRNRIYLGEIEHKGECYPGDHDAIVDQVLFDAVQAKLKANRNKHVRRANMPSLLAGKLFDADGNRIYPSHANKNGKRYRYYVSKAVMGGGRSKTRARWSAEALEHFIRQRIADRLSEPTNCVTSESTIPISVRDEFNALRQRLSDEHHGDPVFKNLIQSAQLTDTEITITLAAAELLRHVSLSQDTELNLTWHEPLTVSSRHNGVRRIHTPEENRQPDEVLLNALVFAHNWYQQLMQREVDTIAALADSVGRSERDIKRLLNLVYLAPDLKQQILEGRQPSSISLQSLKHSSAIPSSFEQQRLHWHQQNECGG